MKFLKTTLFATATTLFITACGQNASNGTATAGNSTKAVNTASSPANGNSGGTVVTPGTISEPATEVGSGKEIYATNCMICHKDTGKGGKVTIEGKNLNVDDLTSANLVKKSDDKMFGYISDGAPDDGMPAFADKLRPDEIKSVIAHVRTLQKR